MRNKSIEQLENDYWNEEIEFPSSLVTNCHKYRKVPIKDLTIEQLRLLISQKIGIQYLTELALEKLDENILAEGDIYEGDLLEAVSRIPIEFWNENNAKTLKFKYIVERDSDLIVRELGEKKFDQISERMKTSCQTRTE